MCLCLQDETRQRGCCQAVFVKGGAALRGGTPHAPCCVQLLTPAGCCQACMHGMSTPFLPHQPAPLRLTVGSVALLHALQAEKYGAAEGLVSNSGGDVAIQVGRGGAPSGVRLWLQVGQMMSFPCLD